MNLNFQNERILAVVAHPDDAELLCAGTLARASKVDGADIAICVLCEGDKGQPDPPIENLGQVRYNEMKASTELLGAELYWAGFHDGELVDTKEARLKLTEVFRKFRATLILAHSANDYHPDHQAASKLAETASWFCASGGQVTESPPLTKPPALWWMDTIEMQGFEPGFFVDVSTYLPLKRGLLGCHKSQMVRGSETAFSPLEEVMLRQAAARGAQCSVQAAEAFRIHNAWKRAPVW
jgi:LmbE family N-acetylglucosaminyl deacetylase